MKAITILKRCRSAKSDLARLDQQIGRWQDVLTGVSAPQVDPNGGSRGTGDPDKYGRIAGEIDQLEREKAARKEAYAAEKVASCARMGMLPDLEGKVVYDYYVRRWDTQEIARKEKYTAGYVRKTKRAAEQLLEMISRERVDATLPGWYLRKEKEKGGGDE